MENWVHFMEDTQVSVLIDVCHSCNFCCNIVLFCLYLSFVVMLYCLCCKISISYLCFSLMKMIEIVSFFFLTLGVILYFFLGLSRTPIDPPLEDSMLEQMNKRN